MNTALGAVALSFLSVGMGSSAHAAAPAADALLGQAGAAKAPLSQTDELAGSLTDTVGSAHLPELHQQTTLSTPEMQLDRSPLNQL